VVPTLTHKLQLSSLNSCSSRGTSSSARTLPQWHDAVVCCCCCCFKAGVVSSSVVCGGDDSGRRGSIFSSSSRCCRITLLSIPLAPVQLRDMDDCTRERERETEISRERKKTEHIPDRKGIHPLNRSEVDELLPAQRPGGVLARDSGAAMTAKLDIVKVKVS
jgi:hypothetical protein